MNLRFSFNRSLLSGCLLTSLIGLSCTSPPQKPKLSVDEYAQQQKVLLGVVVKLFSEKSSEKMYKKALALQRARVIDCVPIGNECKQYWLLMNQIIQLSKDGVDAGEDQRLRSHAKQLREELTSGTVLLKQQWQSYEDHLAKKETP